ncbi:MAG: M16 family metallopeptidase [Thermodesulfobacteriota bacterium]
MYKRHILDNGIRVLTEEVPHLSSLSLGIWVTRGSRDEGADKGGISHFIEHLLFKGTKNRTAFDIAKEIDSVGGILNAFTSRECTCFYAKVLGKDVRLAVDLLSDILLNSLFDPEEMEKERGVILQEIKMVEDTPDDLVHDLFAQSFWKGHPLGSSILGNTSTVMSISRDCIRSYFQRFYSPEAIVISAAGNLKHEELISLLNDAFGGLVNKHQERNISSPTSHPEVLINNKELEQVHLCLGTTAHPISHDHRYNAYMLNTILGTGMSSRLFQEIREKRGLVYSVYSYINAYVDIGSLVVYAGMNRNTFSEVVSLILKEFDRLRDKEVEDSEIYTAKEHLKGNMLLAMEGSESRMNKLARDEIYFGRHIPVKEIMDKVDKVSSTDIIELAREMFLPTSLALTALGKVDRGDVPQGFC